jgi:hypothetical protein
MFFRIIKPFELIELIELLKIQSETETSLRHRFGNRRQWDRKNKSQC